MIVRIFEYDHHGDGVDDHHAAQAQTVNDWQLIVVRSSVKGLPSRFSDRKKTFFQELSFVACQKSHS